MANDSFVFRIQPPHDIMTLHKRPGTEDLFTDAAKFDILDWCLFGCLLIASGATGLFFAYRSRKRQADVHDYLMGSRKMRTFPVAMSLIGSYVSGVTIVGTPADIYNYGAQYSLICLSILCSGIIVAYVYLPVYFVLKIESSYQYLELRFDRSLRVFASVMFLFDEILFLPIVIYVPSLAFYQVTGINVYIIGSSVCILCIFYTVLGGLKAVIWTDTWQVGTMFAAIVLFAIIGTTQAGGLGPVWDKASGGKRLQFFNIDPSLYTRYTFWNVMFGGTLYWTAFNAVNQTMVQRYMSLPTMQKARKSIWIFSVSAMFVVGVCCFTGLLVYERLGHCDPKTSGALERDDQLLPAYISLLSIGIPGALGVFVAGLFGAALSSMSVVLNSTATVVLEDMIKGFGKKHPNQRMSSLIARITITLLGLLALGLLFVVNKLGSILSVATSLSSIAASTMFGVFTLGMLWPWANAKGVFVGALCGALLGAWIALGSQAAAAQGLIPPDYIQPSLAGCPAGMNKTVTWPPEGALNPENVFGLYKLSFNWVALIGIVTTIIVGIIVSAFTQDRHYTTLDPDLFSPVIHRFFPEHMMKNAGITAVMLQRHVEQNRQPDAEPTDVLLNRVFNRMSLPEFKWRSKSNSEEAKRDETDTGYPANLQLCLLQQL